MENKEPDVGKWYSPMRKLIKRSLENENRDDLSSKHDEDDGTGLGPNSGEDHMPRWLVRVLEKGDRVTDRKALETTGQLRTITVKVVETPGLVYALARLSKADPTIAQAIYCSNHVHHVAKLRREGSFCGYRNIQMMISYIRNAHVVGYEHFKGQLLPSVFDLQELIEQAWEKGFNTSSRDQVGQLRMTRKFIGTSEVEALFLSLNFVVTTRAFVSVPGANAYTSLVKYVSSYFNAGQQAVEISHKAPIFLQRPGHSMTIVGVDLDVQGSYSLLAFDPKYQPSADIRKIASGADVPSKTTKMLKAYRYGSVELARYDAFEIVQLDKALE